MGKESIPLPPRQLKELKEQLTRQRERLIFSGVYCSDEFNLNAEDRSDDVDHANADVRNSERLRFRNREVFYVKKINEALKRIESGEYAVCGDWGVHIGYIRLKARPTAELCIHCKEESEREETNNFLARQSKSLGKKIDLVSHI